MGLANNHAADFGSDALVDSIARLKANDIAVVGAAETPEQAYRAAFFHRPRWAKGGGDRVE